MDCLCEGKQLGLARYGICRVLSHAMGAAFLIFLLGGCVRVAGSAGYWKTGEEGETTARRATFDTADYVPGSPSPGTIDF